MTTATTSNTLNTAAATSTPNAARQLIVPNIIAVSTLVIVETASSAYMASSSQEIIMARQVKPTKQGKLRAADARALANAAAAIADGLQAISRAGTVFADADEDAVLGTNITIHCYCYAHCSAHSLRKHHLGLAALPDSAECLYHSISTGNRG